MNILLNIMLLLLEQNEAERNITTISFVLLGILLLILIIDIMAKGRWVPKSGVVRAIIVGAFLIVLAIIILMEIYYK